MKRRLLVLRCVVMCICVVEAAGCHGPALPAIPGKGGPAWHELQSEHFTLWTDSSVERGKKMIREMEHHRQVVLGVGFTGATAEARSLVFALRDDQEVHAFIPEQFMAFAFSGGPLRQPVIIIPADINDDEVSVVTHELTHVISYTVIRNQPSWFAEGIADFFATVNLDPDQASGNVGEPMPYLVARLKSQPPTPAATMFACDAYACKDDMFYATAWAMVSFLANTHPQELLTYADRLNQLPNDATPADHAKVWAEVFPTLTPSVLDHQLREWLSYGKHTVWRFNVKLQEWPISERVLTDADVLAARAAMRMMFAKPGDAPPPELAEALAAEPTHLLAQLVRYGYKQPIALADAHKVADAHPDDWRAWYLVGHAADWHGEDAHVAWQKACALLAQHPSPNISATWCQQH
ncbi:MAG TPA: DUF1570 domain-containing protein [Kofleriaceae bacterium]|nr:DUF1570 domain-containing protein [Kofleriaceae bacterium]